MTREEAANNALSKVLLVKSTILYLGTGYGKSKLAIDCINKIEDFNFKQNEEETTVSIIVPRQPLINNWKEEIKDLKPSEVEAYLKEHNVCLDNYKTESSKAWPHYSL